GTLFDPAAAERDLAVIENGALARGDGALGGEEAHLDAVGIGGAREGGGRGGVLVADLDLGPDGGSGGQPGDGNPIHLFGDEARALQVVIAADGDALAGGVGGNHVERFAGGYSEALTLSHGEMVHALVVAERTAFGGDDLARRALHGDALFLEVGIHEGRVVAVGDEADLLAIALGGHGETHGARDVAHFGLMQFAERKQSARQLRLGQAEEEVGLIFGLIHGAQQLIAPAGGVEADARVMGGGHVVRAHGIGHLQEAFELDVVIAEGAGDGGASGEILLDEGLHHVLFELPLEVDDVVGDANLLGDAAGVVDIVEGAAASGPRGGPAFGGRQFGEAGLGPQLHG